MQTAAEMPSKTLAVFNKTPTKKSALVEKGVELRPYILTEDKLLKVVSVLTDEEIEQQLAIAKKNKLSMTPHARPAFAFRGKPRHRLRV